MIVSRTCSEISAGDADRRQDEEPRPVEAFRDAPAYVLLGDPGAGKTTAFEIERAALGEQACLISARDFLTFDPQHRPEWHSKTLFIDGLDEVRAGASDARTPFDAIRARLDALGRPRFRLSCREADWLGANDRNRLEAVSPDAKVTVLRLNPLTDSDIAQLLAAYPRVDDAEAFIAEANERGIGDLLRNPQTLDLLAKAVAGGTWPESRRETFELACEQMVQEHSDEHSAALASSSPPAPGQLLDAAGRLCAIQLVAGKAGYTLHGKQDSKDKYPTLEQCGGDHPDRLRLALATKLFKGVSDNRFTPVHRHVSEFLGARYLAQVIGDQTVPLPARRVIALITGADGTVVTEMRGLSAWLAAHCPEARAELIERDPVGVGLYGDVRRFSLHEKRVLLESLGREGSHLGSMWEEAAAFGSLATPDLEPAFRNILEARNRDREAQIFTGFVLCVLEQGVPLPGISEILLGIVRDDTRWPIVKATALDAFIHNCPDGQIRTNELKTLLADIYSEGISDPDNELLGILLTQLYPRDIPPSEVWEYLFEAGERDFYGVYRYFWKIGLLDKSSDEQVAELLDHLQQSPALQHALESRGLEDIPLKLLARGLKARGDQLNTASLYDWLGVGQAEGGYWSSDESAQEIRAWLEQRPEVQKAVILEGLGRCLESEDFDSQAFEVYKRLYHAEQAPDFGLWCLHQADIKANTKPRIANHLLTMVCGTVRGAAHGIVNTQSGSGGLTLDILQAYARKHDLLKAGLDPLLAPHPIPPKYLEERRKNQAYIEERRQKEEQWFEYVRSNEVALRENRAAPFLLHELARKYFGDDSTSNGPKAVEEALRGDQRLTQAVLQGFRGAVDREDVPAFEESLSFQAQGRRHYLAWPFLAGLAEIERTAPEDATQWDDDRIRKAIAFYCGTPFPHYQPEWYQRLLAARPEFVAKVQVQIAVSEFRSGREHIDKLWKLAYDKGHTEVAKHASLPLLRAFPTRCKLEQLRSLDYVLWTAIQYADGAPLQELIERKLTRTSMNVAQRVHWLAAGVIVSPGTYGDLLKDYVRGQEDRIRHVAEFFDSQGRIRIELAIPISECLIRLVGSHVGPDQLAIVGGLIRSKMASSDLLNALIQRLAISPDRNASDALVSLLADPALSAWHEALVRAQDAQRVIWRDASYRHPTIGQVRQTLDGGTPANPGDLAALVMDRLNELAVHIRTGNTDDWRQYWNLDAHGRPAEPRPENPCRDALLSDLQQRLPQGVDAQPEGHYANDKRADIRVSYGGFQVPVEVKKNTHRDVWRAMRDQLMAQYASAPETDGYGIYLVFWFGRQDTQPPPSGKPPADAEELKERLEATLSPAEARKISVCVIDVSRT